MIELLIHKYEEKLRGRACPASLPIQKLFLHFQPSYTVSAWYMQWQWAQSFYKKLNIFIFNHLQQQTFPVNSHLPDPDTTLGIINVFLKLDLIPSLFNVYPLLLIVLHRRGPRSSLYPVNHSQLFQLFFIGLLCRTHIISTASICSSYSIISWTKSNIQIVHVL